MRTSTLHFHRSNNHFSCKCLQCNQHLLHHPTCIQGTRRRTLVRHLPRIQPLLGVCHGNIPINSRLNIKQVPRAPTNNWHVSIQHSLPYHPRHLSPPVPRLKGLLSSHPSSFPTQAKSTWSLALTYPFSEPACRLFWRRPPVPPCPHIHGLRSGVALMTAASAPSAPSFVCHCASLVERCRSAGRKAWRRTSRIRPTRGRQSPLKPFPPGLLPAATFVLVHCVSVGVDHPVARIRQRQPLRFLLNLLPPRSVLGRGDVHC